MVIRITWGRLRAGSWSEFERTYRVKVSEAKTRKTVKGLRGRLLVQDSADKDAGLAISLWDNSADMETYEQSEMYQKIMATFQPFFVGEYKTYRCEVKYTDMLS
jgi:heme-degrading monooxygenase HmoA